MWMEQQNVKGKNKGYDDTDKGKGGKGKNKGEDDTDKGKGMLMLTNHKGKGDNKGKNKGEDDTVKGKGDNKGKNKGEDDTVNGKGDHKGKGDNKGKAKNKGEDDTRKGKGSGTAAIQDGVQDAGVQTNDVQDVGNSSDDNSMVVVDEHLVLWQ